MALATTAGKDPDNWKLRVFTERSNPWEQLLNDQTDASPIVNIWYDNSNFVKGSSNSFERQYTEAIYNIDCYGYGQSSDNISGGHNPGDEAAALEVQKALRYVRNILMASDYAYLKLRGTVGAIWPQSINVFQPQIDANQIQQIVAARLAFQVSFNEFSPQNTPENLETIVAQVKRSEDRRDCH